MTDTLIKVRRSAVPGKKPTTAQLDLGELAVNTYDGNLYLKKNDGSTSIVTLKEIPDVANSVINGVYTTGNQTINGEKTFANSVILATAGTSTSHAVRADRSLQIQAGANITIGGAGTSAQDLTANRSWIIRAANTDIAQSTQTATTVLITSSTGTNATLTSANTTVAGIMTAVDKSKLDGIQTGAQVNVPTNLSLGVSTGTSVRVDSSTGANVTLPVASTTVAGVVTNSSQTFAGAKQFNGSINSDDSNNLFLAVMPNSVGSTGTITLGRKDYTARQHLIEIFNNTTAATNYIKFKVHNGTLSAQTEVMSLWGNGNVNIGTDTSISTLQTFGTTKSTVFSASANGTVSTPAYSFDGDLDTGLYKPTSNVLGITTNGKAAAHFTASGNLRLFDTTGAFYTEIVNQPTANRLLNLPDGGVTLVTGTMVPTTGTGATGTWAIDITGSSSRWATARKIDLVGGVTGSATIDGTSNVSITTVLASHTHSFDSLTGKDAGTGMYSTSSVIEAGRGSGGVALTVNDGGGNANVTFNHRSQVPEQNGNSGRITLNTDATSSSEMAFEVASNVTSGVSTPTTKLLRLNETKAAFTVLAEAPTFSATSITSGGFQGIASDSYTTPSFTWSGDLDTGIFRSAANVVGVTAAANTVITFGSNNIFSYRPFYILPFDNANSTVTMANSRDIIWRGKYWNGSSSVNVDYRALTTILDTAGSSEWSLSLSSTPLVTVNQQGRVGFGITSPLNERVEISGSARLYGFGAAIKLQDTRADMSGNTVHIVASGGITGQLLIMSAGHINPQSNDAINLNTSGTTRVTVDSTGLTIGNGGLFVPDYVTHSGDTNTYIGFPSNDTIVLTTAGTNRIYVNSTGNVGIGTTSPSTALEVNGTTTSTAFNSLSDIELKTNIEPIVNAIDTIKSLDGVKYKWKSDMSNSMGVIAQQVEQVLPQLVENYEYKSVNYNGLVAVLIEAMKQQQNQIDNLRNQLINTRKELNLGV